MGMRGRTTVFVKIYRSKGNSDTGDVEFVVPKKLIKKLKLKKGISLEAKVDDKNGLLICRKK